jgi:hypothetical protein
MRSEVVKLAYKGEWEDLLALLKRHPELANSVSEPKGYTPLHQAAWHGANLFVVGALLALGASPSIRTNDKNLSALQIAADRHPARDDLQFLLVEHRRSIAQLMRKIAAETPELFGPYDGNQVLFDRLIDCFGSDSCCQSGGDFKGRLSAAFMAITGNAMDAIHPVQCGPNQAFSLDADPTFWSSRFERLLLDLSLRASCIPVEKHWAVVSDVFDPAPDSWGLRGDLFLWMEMRQMLCHVPLPSQPEALEPIITSAYFTLTGETLDPRSKVRIPRFARGGMSSGLVSGEFWARTFIPLIRNRAQWLFESWQVKDPI